MSHRERALSYAAGKALYVCWCTQPDVGSTPARRGALVTHGVVPSLLSRCQKGSLPTPKSQRGRGAGTQKRALVDPLIVRYADGEPLIDFTHISSPGAEREWSRVDMSAHINRTVAARALFRPPLPSWRLEKLTPGTLR